MHFILSWRNTLYALYPPLKKQPGACLVSCVPSWRFGDDSRQLSSSKIKGMILSIIRHVFVLSPNHVPFRSLWFTEIAISFVYIHSFTPWTYFVQLAQFSTQFYTFSSFRHSFQRQSSESLHFTNGSFGNHRPWFMLSCVFLRWKETQSEGVQ